MLWKSIGRGKEIEMGYIDRFENVQQIKECAKYYINLLGLQDWRILFVHGVPRDPSWAGQCESIFEEKCAKITIDNRVHNDLWFKEPQELVLIHELIHCKIELYDNDTMSGKMVYQQQHTLVDDWARSIFYARYNLTHEDMYFKENESCQ